MILKNWFARIFQVYPWLGKWVIRLYRLMQPRYSIGVSGILLDDQGRVLLVEHVFHLDYKWGLPGGWIGRQEAPEEAVRREFEEETRLQVRATVPLAVNYGERWKNHLDIYYLVEQVTADSTIHLCYELSDYRWCALDDLPPLKKGHRQALELVREEKPALVMDGAAK